MILARTLSFREELAGGFARNDDMSALASVECTCEVEISRSHARLWGTIGVEGVVSDANLTGALHVSRERRALVYDATFPDRAGRCWTLSLERRLDFTNLYASWTIVRGALHMEGDRVGWLVLRFNPRDDVFRFVRDVRWRRE